MTEPGGGRGFPLEALAGLFVLQQMRRQKLQRDSALEFEILGLVDHPHAASAEFGEDLVVADRAADHDGQIVPLPDYW